MAWLVSARRFQKKLAAEGRRVAVTFSPTNKTSDQWLADMKEDGFEFQALPCEAAAIESCEAWVAAALGPIEILVKNAGITKDRTFRKMTKSAWDAVSSTNLDSVFSMTKQVCEGMLEKGWGWIINVSSVNGSKGAFVQKNYAAVKAGMHGFTKSLALECATKGITVNTISPCYIGTKMVTSMALEVLETKILPQISIARLGTPEEVAGLIVNLCPLEAAFVNGANIAINGGQHMQ